MSALRLRDRRGRRRPDHLPCRSGGADTGESADDIIKAQDRHLKEAEKAGDVDHQPAREEMKARWRHPKRSLGWYRDVKQTFADLPAG